MACEGDSLPTIGSTEFFARIASAPASANDFPLAGSIELTLRCNLRCRHCYTRYPGAAEGEMAFARIERILDRLRDSGVLFLLLTGGEILMRRDFRDIYLSARAKGFLVTLFTNGTLVDAPTADLLAAAPPRRIEITVYGHTRETYESVTGIPGSFDRFRQGLSLLMERRLPVHLKMMVLRGNAHEFEQVRDWATAQGASFRYDAVVNPRLDGDMFPAQERLPADRVAELRVANGDERDEWRRLRDATRMPPHDGLLFRCGAGTRAFHIDPRGQMYPCMMWRTAPYDPLGGALDGGWQAHVRDLRGAKMPADSACLKCADALNCGICAAVSRLETGVAGKEVDYYCAIARACEKLLQIEP